MLIERGRNGKIEGKREREREGKRKRMLDLFGQAPGLLSLKRALSPGPILSVSPGDWHSAPCHLHEVNPPSAALAFTTFITFYRHSLASRARAPIF